MSRDHQSYYKPSCEECSKLYIFAALHSLVSLNECEPAGGAGVIWKAHLRNEHLSSVNHKYSI